MYEVDTLVSISGDEKLYELLTRPLIKENSAYVMNHVGDFVYVRNHVTYANTFCVRDVLNA